MVGLVSSGSASAQCEPTTLFAPDTPPDDVQYATGIALRRDVLAVGLRLDEGGFGEEGAVDVYAWTSIGLVLQDRVKADRAVGNTFGTSLALTDDQLFVGARSADVTGDESGTAFVFEKSGAFDWVLAQEIPPPDEGGSMGAAIAVHGSWAVIGAPTNGTSGAAYVYRRFGTDWTFQQKLSPSDSPADVRFGEDVALYGDWCLIAASTNGAIGAGAAYFFERESGTWKERAIETAAETSYEVSFASAVALWGDTAAIGANGSFNLPGKAYVYERVGTTWTSMGTLDAMQPSPVGWGFGSEISAFGDRVVVGRPADTTDGPTRGSAFLFEKGAAGWELRDRLAPEVLRNGDRFGERLATSPERIVGTARHTVSGPFTGAVHVVEVPFGTRASCHCHVGECDNLDPWAGCANSTGAGGHLDACGSASISADDLVLTASQLPPNQLGLLLMGATETTPVPFGDGRRCVGGPIFRFPGRSSGPGGSFTEGPGITAHASAHFPPTGQIVPGSSWIFQAWHRDPLGPCDNGSNVSHALVVQFAP